MRPYTMTSGRTGQRQKLDIVTMVVVAESDSSRRDLQPEHRRILALCTAPHSIAEIAAILRLPMLVTKVLVGDLVAGEHLKIHSDNLVTGFAPPDVTLLQAVLNGIRNV